MSDPEPTVLSLIEDARRAVHGLGDKTADFIRGSDYESLAGPNAILWHRQALRDTDLFAAARLHGSRNEDLTDLVKRRYGVDRYLDAPGVGTASIRRETGSAGSGVIWKGTRIAIFGSNLRLFRVTADTPVAATELTATLPVESLEIGPTGAASQTTNLRIEDQVWDSSWVVESLQCAPGTLFEPASDLIARVRRGREDRRPGHEAYIEEVCRLVGAERVAIFRSNYAGEAYDAGLNVCYVGDLGYSGSASLVKACTLAVRGARVLGDHMQVFPMSRASLDVIADVYLRDAPAVFDLADLERTHITSVRQHLGGTSGGFTFTKTGISSAIARPTPEVQRVDIAAPLSDQAITTAGKFPAVLIRHVVDTVSIRYHGP